MSDLITKELIDNDEEIYVSSDEARKFLNAVGRSSNLNDIAELYNIKVKRIGNKKQYNLNDLKAVLKEAEEYYSQYYTKEYIIDELGVEWSYDVFRKAQIEVPLKYKKILLRAAYLYEKDAVNSIVATYKGGEIITLNDVEYYSSKKVIELLDITQINKAFKSLREDWCIEAKWMGAIGYYYKSSDIDCVLEQTKEYFKPFISSEEAANMLNVTPKKLFGFNEKVLKKYKLDNKYKWFLRQRYSSIKGIMYREEDVVNYLELLSSMPKEKVLRHASISEYTNEEYSVNGDNIYYLGVRYYNKKTVVEKLEITSSIETVMTCLNDDWDIESILVDSAFAGLNGTKAKLYNADQVDEAVKKLRDVASKYYLARDVKKMLTLKQMQDYLTPVQSESKYYRYMKKSINFGRQFMYPKQDVDMVVSKFKNGYTMQDISEKFNLSMDRTRKFIKEFDLEGGSSERDGKNVLVFFADKVDSLLAKKEEFFKEYIPLTEIGEYFGQDTVSSHLYSTDSLERFDIPFYAQDTKHKSKVAFKRSDIIEAGERFKERKDVSNIQNLKADSDYGTFELRLSNYVLWKGFNDGSDYTKKQWFSYAKDWIERTTKKGKRMSTHINMLVYCTPYIKEFLDRTSKKEIFELTSNEVNLVLRSIDTQVNYRAIYTFLKEVAIDRKSKGYTTKFKINDIVTPEERFGIKEKDGDNEIYSLEEYMAVFNYCIDIKKRVDESLTEIKEKGCYVYASTWLYVMLHLNNAWRNGDIHEFPKLYVDDILAENNITSIEWFKDNEISIETARMVVFRVNQKEFEMSKTHVKGAFFCSDELAPAFATSILILSLRHKEMVVESDNIMLFETTYNEINKTMIKRFFKSLGVKGFVFGSTKFNKTVMTFIYYIANITGDSKALVYAMKLRAHIEAVTTSKFYLAMDKKMLEELSRQLFRRGEFGYVASLLVKKISCGKMTFDETTQEIEEINKNFGNLVRLNTTLGFMNDLKNRRREVFQEIDSMDLKAAQETYSNLFAMNLPSKDSVDIGCLFGRDNCRHTEMNCEDCEFNIPTIHMLSDLAKHIKEAIKKCNEANTISEKFKLSLSVERKKLVVIEAIKKFGKDLVYSYLEMSREEFLDELQKVPLPNEVFKLGNRREDNNE